MSLAGSEAVIFQVLLELEFTVWLPRSMRAV